MQALLSLDETRTFLVGWQICLWLLLSVPIPISSLLASFCSTEGSLEVLAQSIGIWLVYTVLAGFENSALFSFR
jgi:hypothetical protein